MEKEGINLYHLIHLLLDNNNNTIIEFAKIIYPVLSKCIPQIRINYCFIEDI